MNNILTPNQIAALKIAYSAYKFKKKVERKVIETIFYQITGKKLGPMYHSIPIVRALIDLTN